MKNNYKAQDLKFYSQNEGETKRFQQRAFELGYEWKDGEKTPSHLAHTFFYLDKFGNMCFGNRLETFIKNAAKQITLEEFLAPQGGEMVEVRGNGQQRWEEVEFICDLGYGFDERYVVRDKHHDGIYYHFEQMRPIKQKQEPLGIFKDFQANIDLLEQAIEGLKKCKPQ